MELDSVWMESACSSQATGKELQAQDEGVLHKLTPHLFSLLMNQLSAPEIHPDPKLRRIIELILEEAALLQNHRAAVRDYRPGLVPIAAGLRPALVLTESSAMLSSSAERGVRTSPGPPYVSGKAEALQPAGAGPGRDARVCGQTPESPGWGQFRVTAQVWHRSGPRGAQGHRDRRWGVKEVKIALFIKMFAVFSSAASDGAKF